MGKTRAGYRNKTQNCRSGGRRDFGAADCDDDFPCFLRRDGVRVHCGPGTMSRNSPGMWACGHVASQAPRIHNLKSIFFELGFSSATFLSAKSIGYVHSIHANKTAIPSPKAVCCPASRHCLTVVRRQGGSNRTC